MMGSIRVLPGAILALAGLLLVARAAPADVIVFYALNKPPQSVNDAPVPPTSFEPGVGTTDLTQNGSPNPLQNFRTDHAGPNSFVGLNASPSPGTMPSSVDDAFNKHDTFSFTVTPPIGKEFDLTSLTFNVEAGGTTNGLTRLTGIRSSLTGSTDLPLSPLISNLISPLTPHSETLTLSSDPAFQGITGPVTFYFAVQTPNGNDTVIFNDVTLNGTVVPEPASLCAWLLLGTLGCCYRWHRGRSRRTTA